MNYINKFLDEAQKILDSIDKDVLSKMIELLDNLRDNCGRLFILGVGGGAVKAKEVAADTLENVRELMKV